MIPEAFVPRPEDATGQLLEEFAEYLANERGLAPGTIANYRVIAALFVHACDPEPLATGRLEAGDIDAFLLARCARSSVGSAARTVSALRAVLRFFYLHGYIATASTAACHKPPLGVRLENSRALDPRDVRLLLASCDRRRSTGRRDFAILTVLARLGLRANEVATLNLDDIDWRAGVLTVTGKGGRRDRLPLPIDVGQALTAYCQRGRPRNSHRALFLQVRAPYGPDQRKRDQPCRRNRLLSCRHCASGTPPAAPHECLCDAAAGAPLFEIGQVMRHRFVVNTALYAKDDLAALANIARPWPGTRP